MDERDERYEIKVVVCLNGFHSKEEAEAAAGDLMGEMIDEYGYISHAIGRKVYSYIDGEDIREF